MIFRDDPSKLSYDEKSLTLPSQVLFWRIDENKMENILCILSCTIFLFSCSNCGKKRAFDLNTWIFGEKEKTESNLIIIHFSILFEIYLSAASHVICVCILFDDWIYKDDIYICACCELLMKNKYKKLQNWKTILFRFSDWQRTLAYWSFVRWNQVKQLW